MTAIAPHGIRFGRIAVMLPVKDIPRAKRGRGSNKSPSPIADGGGVGQGVSTKQRRTPSRRKLLAV